MSQSIESPWDRGKLLFTSVAMTTMMLVVAMINPIPTSPILSSGVASPRLCRQGGASFLFSGFVYPKTHILEEGQVFMGSSCSARQFSTTGN